MVIKLKRTGIYLVGLTIIYTYILYDRVIILASSNKALGEIVAKEPGMLFYKEDTTLLTCAKFNHPEFGTLYADNPNAKLRVGTYATVLYNRKAPSVAHVYTIYTFWIKRLLSSLLLLVPWSAFVWGYVSPYKVVEIRLWEKEEVK